MSPRLRTALLLGALVWIVSPLRGDEREKEYREAASKMACQCGCREQLTVCGMQNCHSATPMRAEIRAQLAQGKSVDEILAGFVARMGKQVLAAPTFKGFDLAAWIAPFALLIAGLIVVSWIAVRMTRQPSAAGAPAPPVSAAVDPRVEAELRDFEEES